MSRIADQSGGAASMSRFDALLDRLGVPPSMPELTPDSNEYKTCVAAINKTTIAGPLNILLFGALFAWFGQWAAAVASVVTAGAVTEGTRRMTKGGALLSSFEPIVACLFALQLTVHIDLGGFAASAGYWYWGTLDILMVAVALRHRRRYLWVAAYCALTAVLFVADPFLRPATHPLPVWLEAFMFANTAAALAGMTFLLLNYYVGQLEAEKKRSEDLLLNILPAPIAARLKESTGAIADAVPHTSVLFSDIVGFTVLSTSVTPAELVALLNTIFSRFDALADKHGVEKIKTIGDAYMAVAGLPDARDDHADAMVAMALDMRDAMADLRVELAADIQVRIGVHSGPVVAGVIGARKFAYDLWGDTVNTASRMESHGVAGAVQISDATRQLLGDSFAFEARGEIAIKGKGPMATFLVERSDGREKV